MKHQAVPERFDHRPVAAHERGANLLADANAGIAGLRAEARERLRQALIARDLRTCTNEEKDTVRDGGGVPSGCTTYAAELEARRQAEQQDLLEEQSADAGCAPGYDRCVPPYPPDVDCPDVGPVTVSGPDPHGLDADGDGVACGGDWRLLRPTTPSCELVSHM